MGFQGKPQIPDPSLQGTSICLSTRDQPALPSGLLSLGTHWAKVHQLSFPSPFMSLSVISRAPWHQEPILGGPAHLPVFLCFKLYISPSCAWREKCRLQRPSKWFL